MMTNSPLVFVPPVIGKQQIDAWRNQRRRCRKTFIGPAPSSSNALVIGIDAGCTTNPGLADLILDHGAEGPQLTRMPSTTNNRSAWEAAMVAMRTAPGGGHIELVGVNKLVQAQAAGMRRCKKLPLQVYLAEYERLLDKFDTVTLTVAERSTFAAGIKQRKEKPARRKAAAAAAAAVPVRRKTVTPVPVAAGA